MLADGLMFSIHASWCFMTLLIHPCLLKRSLGWEDCYVDCVNKLWQNKPVNRITGCLTSFWSFYITFCSFHLLEWRLFLLEMLLFLNRRSRDYELHHLPKQVIIFHSRSHSPFQRRAPRAQGYWAIPKAVSEWLLKLATIIMIMWAVFKTPVGWWL